jgi:addiction module HigA family antidote
MTRRLPTNRPPTHPGEMLLEEYLKPLGVSQTHFASAIGVSYVRLNSIVKGHRAVTPDTALRLERALGASADYWLNLQLVWDLWHAKRSAEARTIRRIRPLPELAKAKRLAGAA